MCPACFAIRTPGTDVATPCAEAPHAHFPDCFALVAPAAQRDPPLRPWRGGLLVLVGHALRAHMSN
eukprot:4589796-Prymnesium_polylepis.1